MNRFKKACKPGRQPGRVELFFAGWCLAVCLTSGGCSQQPKPTAQDAVKRGKYLVEITGCNDCHTPLKMGPNGPEPDMTRMLSGHPEQMKLPPPPKLPEGLWVWLGAGTNAAFSGPWGITYSANLTPDQNTGIGIWTEEKFVRALKLGKHMGQSRQIMPPMPWPACSHMTDDDLKAIYAYLSSIPAITNHVPDYVSPEELNQ